MILFSRFFGSLFLILGTSVGAGIIGLPIKTIGANFVCALFMFFLTWVIMIITAIATLEISTWIDGNLDVIVIYSKVLGKKIGYIIYIIFLLFLYSLMTAYISGGSALLLDLFNINVNYLFFYNCLFIIPFFISIFFGIVFSDYVNRIFVCLLIILYLYLIFNMYITYNEYYKLNVYFELNLYNIKYSELKSSILLLPLIITSFGYHLLIPALNIYLFKKIKLLCCVIIIGSFISLIIYIVWEYSIMTILVNIQDNLSIQILYGCGNPVEKLITLISNNNNNIMYAITLFSFFALSSSFIGVSIGVFDFFISIFKMSKKSLKDRLLALILTFLFPFLFSTTFPYIFIVALNYAGIFASILLIIIPCFVLFYGRYKKNYKQPYILIGGKYIIVFCMLFGMFVIFIEIFGKYLF